MPERHFPVRPNLEQLRHQAKELLRAIQQNEPSAVADLREFHPEPIDPAAAKLADAQLALARSYGIVSWPRLVTSCKLIDAIWKGEIEIVRQLVLKDPRLIQENARAHQHCNWGPPMSYAANVGQTEIIQMLRDLGATDVQRAFDRACLQGKLDTARRLMSMGATLVPGSVMGPCESLSSSGLAFLLDLGAEFSDAEGDRMAPLGLILEIYSRNPEGKRQCLELVNSRIFELPDTPTMALHRGRIDLLERHLQRDPELFSRTFSHEEIFPLELGCHADRTLALHGAPIAGGTLMHLCVDYDEFEIAKWMLENGADLNSKAAIDSDGFGGHTALYGCVVSQPFRCGRQKDAAFFRWMLENGADPNVRVSLRKQLRFVDDETEHQFHNVTPLEFGQQFQDQDWVNKSILKILAEL